VTDNCIIRDTLNLKGPNEYVSKQNSGKKIGQVDFISIATITTYANKTPEYPTVDSFPTSTF